MNKLSRFSEGMLLEWLQSKRRKPLLLRGARQVGKSTLVREFASHNGLVLNEINLERHLAFDKIFETLDTTTIIAELEAFFGSNVQESGSLVFLDEIQATPHALQALRYLYEDKPQIPVIAAGSLLEFVLGNHAFPMPVGRIEYCHLGPMTFKEYVKAIAPDLYKYFSQIHPHGALPQIAHEKLVRSYREYLFVGGMPEAVSVYEETRSLEEVSRVHRSIVETYLDDFSKYAKQNQLLLLQRVFRSIPRMIGNKIKYSNISRDDSSRDVKNAISLLSNARLCTPIVHSHCSGLPLNSDVVKTNFKLIFMDIGLVNHICGIDWLAMSSLDDTALVNKGALADQFVGQHLLAATAGQGARGLNYWIREGKPGNAEVDYVISRGDLIIPVEVKAGKSGTLKSLQQFAIRKRGKLAVRFDLNPCSLQDVAHIAPTSGHKRRVSFQLLSLPLYAVEELYRNIDLCRS